MTNDPFKIMTNGSARALFNTSGRFMVGGNFSAEATIHSGGASWANEEFYTKINASSICSYRANWSSANYWGWGSDGAYTNASDERLKTDIANVPYGLDAVMLMKPRKYKMIQEGTQHVGFIAQELYDIVPEAVQEGANDDMNENGYPINPWGIDLASLTSVLCKAIQDQQAQIEELKRIVSTLI
ncbi:Intramolecular chaperone auto-processing domain [Phytophthora cactorum]|nr:Intramolecular chaperone auto-processing domain [Phytophthora cactorum]